MNFRLRVESLELRDNPSGTGIDLPPVDPVAPPTTVPVQPAPTPPPSTAPADPIPGPGQGY